MHSVVDLRKTKHTMRYILDVGITAQLFSEFQRNERQCKEPGSRGNTVEPGTQPMVLRLFLPIVSIQMATQHNEDHKK